MRSPKKKLSQDGRYYVFSAKEPKEFRDELDKVFDVMTINDIDRVVYRGKNIYIKEENHD